MITVLFDDERSFIRGYRDEALVVRSVAEAEALFSTLQEIDELWLDFILSFGEDTTEALHALQGVTVKRVIFHSSAWEARELVRMKLKRFGVTCEMEWPPIPPVLFCEKSADSPK